MAPKKLLFLTVPLRGHVVHTARLSEWFLQRQGQYEVHVGCPSEGAAHLPKGVTIHTPIEGEPDPDAEEIEEPFTKAAISDNWQESMAQMIVNCDLDYILGLPLFGIRLLRELTPDVVICDHTYGGGSYLHTACKQEDVPLVVIFSMGRPESMNSVSNIVKFIPSILSRTGAVVGMLGPLLSLQWKLQQEVGMGLGAGSPPVQITPGTTVLLQEPPPDNLILTGPFLPLPARPLGLDAPLAGYPDLQQWLLGRSSEPAPVVFIALGTLVRPSRELQERIVDALDDPRWRVLWALPKAQQALLPQRSFSRLWRIESFVPQLAVLKSGHISCFISHCGANSTLESMLHGVPMVCMPFFGDQYEWAASVCDFKRAGIVIDKNDSEADEIRDGVAAVIEDKSYRHNAEAVAQEMREEAESALAHLGVQADKQCGAGLPIAAAVIEAALDGQDPRSVVAQPPKVKVKRRQKSACC